MSSHQPEASELTRGWENYPSNLSTLIPHENLELCHRRLQKDAKRLFNSNPEAMHVKFETVLLHAGPEEGQETQRLELITDSIKNEQRLEETLIKHLTARGSRFIFLYQAHSWAPFENSESAFRKIFTAVKVRPSFLNFIHTFGHPRQGYETDFSGGYDYWFETNNGLNFDFFYNIKYIARTGRDNWPWSERKMGVCQKYDHSTLSSTWIIVQPTTFARRLPELVSSCTPVISHIHLLESTLRSWKAYLKYLETQVQEDNRQARLATYNELHGNTQSFAITCSSIQSLQHKCELIHKAILSLRSNIEILVGLQLLETKIRTITNIRNPQWPVSSDQRLEVCLSSFTMSQQWAEDMLDRAKQASSLMKGLVNSRESQALIFNATSINRLVEESKQDGQVMLDISKATKKDSSIMRRVAIVTVIYLPGTFVATLFSTGFVNMSLTEATLDVRHNSVVQAWVYTLVTIGLLAITLIALFYAKVLVLSRMHQPQP